MDNEYIFHHIGIATKSIRRCVNIYEKLGYKSSDIKVEPTQDVKICFLSMIGNPTLEVIEPLSSESPITRIVQNSGTTPYHTCYEVADIQKSIEKLEELNFRLLFEPIMSKSMQSGFFCYLFSSDIGLIELYQRIY